MKIEKKVIALSVIIGFIVTLIDALLDYHFFYEGSFWDMLVSGVPGFEIYIRSVWIIVFFVIGIIMSRIIVKRKQVEEALRESEERYRRLVELSPYAIAIHSQGKIVFSNNAAAKLLGAENPSQLIGKKIMDVVHPDYQEIVLKRIRQMKEEGRNVDLTEEKFVRLDGSVVDVEVAAMPFTYQGKPGMQVVGRDITERKRVEEELRRERDFSTTLVQASPAFFVAIDASGRTLMMNKAMLDGLGYTIDEVEGKEYLSNFVPEADCNKLSKIFEKLVNLNEQTVNENRVLAKDGRELLVEWHGRPVFKANGKIDYFFGLGIDITERRKIEEKIREQAALLDNAHDAISVIDLENRIIYWNKGAVNQCGWTVEEAVGKNAIELLYKKEPAMLIEARKSVLEKGEWGGELHQVTKNGKESIVKSSWTLMRDSDGKQKSILIINTDITEQKKLEAQFLRAQRMESIGTLASGITHDINNVLSPIMLSLQLLQEKFTDDESRKLIEILERSAERGASLIKQVQSFARGVKGERMTIQIAHIISEIRQMARETFPRSIEVRSDLSGDLWDISGDATQLHQVLMNLCVNARDAMPDGGILRISAENILIDEKYALMNIDARVGPYIVITVSDTGIGIPPDIIDKIFEPFFTTKEHGKGTGLGLSTSLAIVKSHGGFISVYSEVGKGTTFKVYIPAIKTIETQKAEKEQLELPKGHGELILVVDDEARVREITKEILESYGYRVITANDGAEAIALYSRNREETRVVLMDMMMPVMDGPASIRELRKIDPTLKIIAVSGLTEDEKLADDSCMTQAFLSKPYTARKLLNKIDEVLNISV